MTNHATQVVVQELFRNAEQSVLVVGYELYQAESVFRTLADRMAEQPITAVRMFLNIKRPCGKTSTDSRTRGRFRPSLSHLRRSRPPKSSPAARTNCALPPHTAIRRRLPRCGAHHSDLHRRCDRFSQTLCKNIIFVFCSPDSYRNVSGDLGGGGRSYRLSMIAQKHGRALD